ncbi:maleylpyruvate isomerase N-terminal domain-containing protein [Streptomyces microflavus]|uniref:MDMPI_N domain containing protein n=1 Tax=Streptomyces microflavus DSM 40593 TaxID=1303692 RepID=N0CGC8_STRMI|nr:maleylpyruvate isomerase N-terminal domain-containing protein [Streptomyces microflavus]AGK75191.1 MDMPI_N domain containing protein [Streptomyces microflavus DSM 40593]
MPGLRHHIPLRAEWLPDELLRAVERADGRDLLHEERWSLSPWRLPSSCCRPDVEGCWSSEWNPHAVAAAPSLDVQVPTCPEWTLFDLVQHLGEGRRALAATIAAGPDAASKSAPQGDPSVPRERDAQLTVGVPQPLPDEVALDGVEEFLTTICTTTVAWPHEPAGVDYHATEGRSWRNWLSDDGARLDRLPEPGAGPTADEEPDAADASDRGTANELVLGFYGRIPFDSLKLDGNGRIFDQLVAWAPEQ